MCMYQKPIDSILFNMEMTKLFPFKLRAKLSITTTNIYYHIELVNSIRQKKTEA